MIKLKNRIKVISGFPGIGKTYYKQTSSLNILDSDSSKFSWIDKGIRNPDFPHNYIKHIKENLDKVDVILVSSHKLVRDALVNNNIYFVLIFPERNLKEEYIKRFEGRGSDKGFINMIRNNWNSFIDDMNNQRKCKPVILKTGEFLKDCLE